MALKYGFFNSSNGDRKYDAEDISSIFDGIIEDGVFATIGKIFAVTPGTGLQVLVDTGKAWFNHTWTVNSEIVPLSLEEPDITLDRYDAVVLEINHSESVRANSLKILKGNPASEPTKPVMTREELINQYPLAYVLVKHGATSITAAEIEIMVGKGDCPFVRGPIETVPIDELFSQWEAEFDTWFENVQSQLEGDIAANLQRQIDERVKIADKASEEEAIAGESNEKWLTPKTGSKIAVKHGFDIGDVKTTIKSSLGDNWLLCNGVLLPPDYKYDKLRGELSNAWVEISPSKYSSDAYQNCTDTHIRYLSDRIVLCLNSNFAGIGGSYSDGSFIGRDVIEIGSQYLIVGTTGSGANRRLAISITPTLNAYSKPVTTIGTQTGDVSGLYVTKSNTYVVIARGGPQYFLEIAYCSVDQATNPSYWKSYVYNYNTTGQNNMYNIHGSFSDGTDVFIYGSRTPVSGNTTGFIGRSRVPTSTSNWNMNGIGSGIATNTAIHSMIKSGEKYYCGFADHGAYEIKLANYPDLSINIGSNLIGNGNRYVSLMNTSNGFCALYGNSSLTDLTIAHFTVDGVQDATKKVPGVATNGGACGSLRDVTNSYNTAAFAFIMNEESTISLPFWIHSDYDFYGKVLPSISITNARAFIKAAEG